MPDLTRLDLTHLSATSGGSRRLTGHIARPDGPGPWPGVVVVHEALGVDDVMLRQAERMARAGYLTLIPALLRIAGVGPHPESAADAWHRIEAFFGEHLAAARDD